MPELNHRGHPARPFGDDDGLCEECSCIDPYAIDDADDDNEDDWPRTDYKLKNSHDMHESAATGCKGCRFFLDILAESCDHDRESIMQAFVQREQDIFISPGQYIITDLELGAMESARVYLDLCLAAAEDDYKYRPGWGGKKRPVPADPKSDYCMNMAASWIEECVENHDECAGDAEVLLPTRVVEVMPATEAGAELRARLHISSDGEKGRFATLSHCWGGKVNFVLKNGNLEQLESRVPVEQLP